MYQDLLEKIIKNTISLVYCFVQMVFSQNGIYNQIRRWETLISSIYINTETWVSSVSEIFECENMFQTSNFKGSFHPFKIDCR